MKRDLLPALRKELENSFGRKILSSRDCLQMVDDIYQKTGTTVNANTLRRFFGLVKTNYSASPSTITILSKYCGFNSIDEIETITHGTSVEDAINKEDVLHFLVSIYKSVNVPEGQHAFMDPLVQQTVTFLERNPALIEKFQREVAKTATGQHYYYETNVNMDRLNDYYGQGLRHYLRAKNTDEAQVFVLSLQVFRYWLTGEQSKLDLKLAALQSSAISHNYSPRILGRLIAARIFAADSHQEPIDKVLVEASRYHVSNTAARSVGHGQNADFELAIAEALILTGQVDEGKEYIRRGKAALNARNGVPANPFTFWEQVIPAGKEQSLKKFEIPKKSQLPPSYNYYLHKRYHNLVMLALNSSSQKQHEQLESLVRETGYIRFLRLAAIKKKRVASKDTSEQKRTI